MPSIEYFAHWHHHRHMIIEACEHYQKRSWRNKTAIIGPDHPLLLSVPLKKGKNNKVLIPEVEISYDEGWNRIHMTSIRTAYGKTAFFEELETDLEEIILQRHHTLWELNITLITFFTQLLRGDWSYSITDTYLHTTQDSLVDMRDGIPAGIQNPDIQEIPTYEQVHRLNKTFMPNLSILDLLCHLGPGATDYLERFAKPLYDQIC